MIWLDFQFCHCLMIQARHITSSFVIASPCSFGNCVFLINLRFFKYSRQVLENTEYSSLKLVFMMRFPPVGLGQLWGGRGMGPDVQQPRPVQGTFTQIRLSVCMVWSLLKSVTAKPSFLGNQVMPWLVWLIGLSDGLQTRVTCSIPSQGTCLDGGLDPQLGVCKG